MKCSYCGSIVDSGNSCPNCGAPLEKVRKVSAVVQTSPVDSPIINGAHKIKPLKFKSQTDSVYAEEPSDVQAKMRGCCLEFLVLLGALILIVCIIGACITWG